MKSHLLLIAICILQISAIAQQKIKTSSFKKNEIGLAFFVPSGSTISSGGPEILYKHWFKPWQCYRVVAGFNTETAMHTYDYKSQNNKVLEMRPSTRTEYAYIGIGIEAQRQFYKRVFMFAAVDTRFMFGDASHKVDSYLYLDSTGSSQETSKAGSEIVANSKDFKWELTPSVGAKITFPKISFGVEAYCAGNSYHIANSANRDYDTSVLTI